MRMAFPGILLPPLSVAPPHLLVNNGLPCQSHFSLVNNPLMAQLMEIILPSHYLQDQLYYIRMFLMPPIGGPWAAFNP